jgi:hypothetical protein
MVVSGKIDLIYRTILFAPVRKLDKAILLRNLGDGADDRVAWCKSF